MSGPLRIGTDLVHIPRFERSLAQPAFVSKVFHPTEVDYCSSKTSASATASYAARFAAKEAFAKALGSGLFAHGIGLHDVWIENEESGRPRLCLAAPATSYMQSLGFSGTDVSLSHHGEYALATVLIF